MARQSRRRSAVDFNEVIEALLETRAGQEASMYGHLRDLFVHFLGYAGRQVVIDTAGDAGRPDITCRAPSGLIGPNGRPHEIDWIVVEAKDQRSGLSQEENRERIFAEKSKYITPNTAWFVMADPIIFVARPVLSGDYDTANDIIFYFKGDGGEEEFTHRFASLHADVAGVPDKLRRFRQGDTSLIATEKLIVPDEASRRAQNRAQVARRAFYSTLRDTTRALQEATLQTLRTVWPKVEEIQSAVAAFEEFYGSSTFDAHSLTISGNPRLEQRRYGADVARLNRRLRKAG
ncbi:MAG TPA: hypothetical protein VM326_03230, partial [Sphingomicrobium sp.]|nr:hypothetical protein [Sphingomicrobium sp.]